DHARAHQQYESDPESRLAGAGPGGGGRDRGGRGRYGGRAVTAATSRIGPDAGAWSRDEFVRRLRNVLERRYHHLHPFNRRMHAGELSRDELQRWVANRFYYQVNIPIKDALILSNCPEPDVRRTWIQRIIDHDGRPGDEGGIEAWLRLGHAMGVSREDLLAQRRLLPGVRFAVDGYVSFCRSQPWLEAVAASLTELFAPSIVQERLAAMLSHYRWVDPDGLQYFKNRLSQAPRDADHALALVTERLRTRDQQERAVAALAARGAHLQVSAAVPVLLEPARLRRLPLQAGADHGRMEPCVPRGQGAGRAAAGPLGRRTAAPPRSREPRRDRPPGRSVHVT